MLTARQIAANKLLRDRRVFDVAVRILHTTQDAEGRPVYEIVSAVLGPATDAGHVKVKREGAAIVETVPVGHVLVPGDTAERLEAAQREADEATEARIQSHYAAQVERMVAETAARAAVGLSPWQNRRDGRGQYAGRYRAIRV